MDDNIITMYMELMKSSVTHTVTDHAVQPVNVHTCTVKVYSGLDEGGL